MTRSQNRGSQVRREQGLHDQVDAETMTNRLGLEVHAWPSHVLQGMQAAIAVGNLIISPYGNNALTLRNFPETLKHA